MCSKAKDSLQKEMLRCLEQEDLQCLQDLVQKQQVDLDSLRSECGGSLLHHCVRHSCCGAILRFLLEQGVSARHANREGKLPLHVAFCKAASLQAQELKSYYSSIIEPLIKVSGYGVWRLNTAREPIAQQWRELKKRMGESSASSESDTDGESGCSAQTDHSGESQQQASGENSHTDYRDPYDAWRDVQTESSSEEEDDDDSDSDQEAGWRGEPGVHSRFWHQRFYHQPPPDRPPPSRPQHHKPPPRGPPPQRPPQGPAPAPQRSQRQWLIARKRQYENSYERFLCSLDRSDHKLTFQDIPWPAHNAKLSVQVLFVDLEPCQDEHKRYLRCQMLRWHPDKFLQKFGDCLCEEDREKILTAVKELAQCLNSLAGGRD